MECEYKHIEEVQQFFKFEQGCTCPALSILDNGTQVVYKYPDNPYGPIALLNEYVSYHLAKKMGLMIPNAGIAFADDNTKVSQKSNHNISGVGFYSEYISKSVPFSDRAAKRMMQFDQAARMVLFDCVVHNTDRYAANVLISLEKGIEGMYIIDHSHAFGDPEWDKKSLHLGDVESPAVWQANAELYQRFSAAGADLSEKKLFSEAEWIRSQVTSAGLDEIFRSIPREWREYFSDDQIAHMKQYVQIHIDDIDAIVHTVMRERGEL